MLARTLLLFLLVASTAQAATTYKVPISIVPGSLTIQLFGGGNFSTFTGTFPFSGDLAPLATYAGCSSGLVTVSAELVDNGIEVEIDGFAAGSGCTLAGSLDFQLEIQVPELGGTSTTAWLVPMPLVFDFTDFSLVYSNFADEGAETSSIPEGVLRGVQEDPRIFWNVTAPDPSVPAIDPLEPHVWIPGDTMRIPVTIGLGMSANSTHDAQGTARVRYEYRVTVPEPSAALPLGVATLAGLASMRGR
ncbi:MAG: hypothetical protein H6748_15380 [Spirochaetaceae bacterium]|nr:hypothetical protein [Myxococcales bacterium]MCB9725430.1 hypothetical protein [Spirochaetaceae bacterium]